MCTPSVEYSGTAVLEWIQGRTTGLAERPLRIVVETTEGSGKLGDGCLVLGICSLAGRQRREANRERAALARATIGWERGDGVAWRGWSVRIVRLSAWWLAEDDPDRTPLPSHDVVYVCAHVRNMEWLELCPP